MSYLDEEKALTQVPTLAMLLQPLLTIEERALALAQRFMESAKSDTLEVGMKKDTSQAGGGSLPAVELPTFIVTLTVKGVSVNTFAQLLREATPYAVVARIKEDKLCFDARTIADSEIEPIAAAVEHILVTL
jgi:L-seryl-tRNA(Ser) seleniumtransferase